MKIFIELLEKWICPARRAFVRGFETKCRYGRIKNIFTAILTFITFNIYKTEIRKYFFIRVFLCALIFDMLFGPRVSRPKYRYFRHQVYLCGESRAYENCFSGICSL